MSLQSLLPDRPRLAVLGSTDFWHRDSERTCIEIGRQLATLPSLVLLTGGVEGIGEAVGRSYFAARTAARLAANVYHLLPRGEEAWDYGQTFFAGDDMTARREILARLSGLYLIVEGGPGVAHEAEVATRQGALIVPVGRSGGFAATCQARVERPAPVTEEVWQLLGSPSASAEEAAQAAVYAVASCLAALYCR